MVSAGVILLDFFHEYSKHTALNLGQLARDFRFFCYHPKADKFALEGTFKHKIISLFFRLYSMGNNLLFSVLPPQLHHTKQDLHAMHKGSYMAWFKHGYMPWRFFDPSK